MKKLNLNLIYLRRGYIITIEVRLVSFLLSFLYVLATCSTVVSIYFSTSCKFNNLVGHTVSSNSNWDLKGWNQRFHSFNARDWSVSNLYLNCNTPIRRSCLRVLLILSLSKESTLFTWLDLYIFLFVKERWFFWCWNLIKFSEVLEIISFFLILECIRTIISKALSLLHSRHVSHGNGSHCLTSPLISTNVRHKCSGKHRFRRGGHRKLHTIETIVGHRPAQKQITSPPTTFTTVHLSVSDNSNRHKGKTDSSDEEYQLNIFPSKDRLKGHLHLKSIF